MAAGFPAQHETPRIQAGVLALLAGHSDPPGQDLYDHGSPCSASSSNNQLHTLAQDTPRIINIPFKILLGITLQQLGLSKAEYHLELCENNEVHMTILFNTSTLREQVSTVYVSVSGIKSRSYETAEDSACQKAIEYIEEATNSVVRDLSYARLVCVKEMYQDLLLKLKKAAEYKRKLARGWFLAVRHMSSFLEQILNITSLFYSGEEGHIEAPWDNLLSNFEELGSRLKHAGIVLEKHLEKMRRARFF
uniref:Uncharacterized protein n=2 Tax=Avena sativa TaxID=4498 RepID=A0ACD5XF65_AVESA